MPKVVETDSNRAIAPIKRRVKIYAQAGDVRQFNWVGRAGRQHTQALFRGLQLASQELAFGPLQLKREYELMAALGAVGAVLKQRRAAGEILERGGKSGGGLSPPARHQVEFGQLLAFVF